MKKIFVIITLFALCNIYVSIAQCSYPNTYTTVTVYTPNNLPVTAATFNGTDPNITQGDIAAWTLYLAQNYGAVYMGNPTNTYNCHGYAWHMTDDNNPTPTKSAVWINQGCLGPYMSNNGGYVSCSESEATKVFYHPDGDHSAIRLDSYWYQSKWGSNYLVKHPPNAVDYRYQASKPKTYWKRASYTVSFNLNGASGSISNQTVLAGGYATKPSPNPDWTGYTFDGWYDNSGCTGSAVNFATNAITSNKTFYAKWTPITVTSGFDFIIYNWTSFTLSEIWLVLEGSIGGGSSVYLLDRSPEYDLLSGQSTSGSSYTTFTAPPNTPINNMKVYFNSSFNGTGTVTVLASVFGGSGGQTTKYVPPGTGYLDFQVNFIANPGAYVPSSSGNRPTVVVFVQQ